MVHIAYGDSAAGCIREAIDTYGLPGSEVIPHRDDFTQGPISECHASMSTTQRQDYWTAVLRDISVEMDVHTFYKESLDLLQGIADEEEVVIWQGDSCHDILATAWLITYLEEKDLQWSIIDLSALSPDDLNDNLPPVNIAMFAPVQLTAMFQYRQIIPHKGQDQYRYLWKEMCRQNGAYRIKEADEIKSVPVDHHDAFILNHIPKKWTPVAHIIGRLIQASRSSLSDTTIDWRIRNLIYQGNILARGQMTDMRSYEICAPSD